MVWMFTASLLLNMRCLIFHFTKIRMSDQEMSLNSLDSVEVKCPSPMVIFRNDQSSEGTQTREI